MRSPHSEGGDGAGRVVEQIGLARNRFLDRYQATWRGRYFSAGTLAFQSVAEPFVRRYLGRRVLDAGSGRGAWKSFVVASGGEYKSLDLAARADFHPDFVADVTDMRAVASGSFDTVLCHQVLEHVPRPWLAASEIHRVLEPRGRAIVSVPHLSRYHEWPNDFFRFTSRGLEQVFLDAGFRTVDLRPYGGVLAFLHHQIATVFPGPLLMIPFVGTALSLANLVPTACFRALDLLGPALAPMGVIGCFERASSEPDSPGRS